MFFSRQGKYLEHQIFLSSQCSFESFLLLNFVFLLFCSISIILLLLVSHSVDFVKLVFLFCLLAFKMNKLLSSGISCYHLVLLFKLPSPIFCDSSDLSAISPIIIIIFYPYDFSSDPIGSCSRRILSLVVDVFYSFALQELNPARHNLS